jgi:hypothetical protein
VSADNAHTVRFPFCNLVYWNGNSAAGAKEQWTHCYVEGHGSFPSFRFTPEQSDERDRLLEFLRKAYECGRTAKAREVRKVLEFEA